MLLDSQIENKLLALLYFFKFKFKNILKKVL